MPPCGQGSDTPSAAQRQAGAATGASQPSDLAPPCPTSVARDGTPSAARSPQKRRPGNAARTPARAGPAVRRPLAAGTPDGPCGPCRSRRGPSPSTALATATALLTPARRRAGVALAGCWNVPAAWIAGGKAGHPSMRALRGLARGIAPAQRCACQRRGGGPSPGKCPAAHYGRGPLPITDLLVCGLPLRAGGGTAGRVSGSRPHWRKRCHRCNGRGHRPCQSATLPLDQPGAKAPGQRPPRPRRALCTRRAGRWPLMLPDLPVCGAPSRAGGGNAGRVS